MFSSWGAGASNNDVPPSPEPFTDVLASTCDPQATNNISEPQEPSYLEGDTIGSFGTPLGAEITKEEVEIPKKKLGLKSKKGKAAKKSNQPTSTPQEAGFVDDTAAHIHISAEDATCRLPELENPVDIATSSSLEDVGYCGNAIKDSAMTILESPRSLSGSLEDIKAVPTFTPPPVTKSPSAEFEVIATPIQPQAPPIIDDSFDGLLDTGDFKFHTSDGVVVRAHMLILRTASPRFRGSTQSHISSLITPAAPSGPYSSSCTL
ncbi:hypothetical protein DL93DRAFT_1358263 [Clavulina sp. PMI_390]|nr:hypothetical protein DL93DRAFT_1358263 [Clavulina sp. PMI_390]